MDERVRRGTLIQLDRWRALVAGGASRVGWKIGLNDPRVQRHLGLDGCVVGHLTLATTLVPGDAHSLAGSTRVSAEAEIAVHLGDEIGAGASREEIVAAVAGFGAAIELVDLDRPLDDLEAIVEANVFHRAVLFGPTHPCPDLDGLTARVVVAGTEVATSSEAVDPIAAVRLVADLLAGCGERLIAGDRIITGSLTPPIWVAPGDVVGVEVGPLGSLTLALTV